MTWPILFQDNVFAKGNIVASGTAVGNFAPSNVADLRNYTWWQPNALPATLTVDLGAPQPVDYFAVFGHNLFSSGCTIELIGSTDNFALSNVVVATVTPGSDHPFALTFASASYRYWKILITGGAVLPAIAMILAGAGLYMPSGVFAGFDPVGSEVVGSQNTNDNGNPLGTIIDSQVFKQTLNFRVSKAWLRATWEAAWKAGLRSAPALLAWDLANYPSEIRLVRIVLKWAAPHQQGPNAQLTFDVTGPETA